MLLFERSLASLTPDQHELFARIPEKTLCKVWLAPFSQAISWLCMLAEHRFGLAANGSGRIFAALRFIAHSLCLDESFRALRDY